MNKKILSLASMALATIVLMGSGCPLIPEIEEKVVELALGSSTTIPFEARGIINEKGETELFDFSEEIDLEEILDDAGVDVDDVIDIALAGVAYRVVRADPEPSRTITNTTVSLSRDGGAQDVPFVTSFSDTAGETYDFRTAPLDPAGVSLVNAMLDDLLAAVQNGTTASVSGSVTWRGTSEPVSEDTNFDWEIRVDITIVGTVTVDAPN